MAATCCLMNCSGPGFALVVNSARADAILPLLQGEPWRSLNARVIALPAPAAADPRLAHYSIHVFLLRPNRYVAASFRTDEVAQGAEKVRTLIASTRPRSDHSAAALALLPIAALTRGMTSSAISCIERLASVGSTQSMPA